MMVKIKDTVEKISIIHTKILLATSVTNTFLTSGRGKNLYIAGKVAKLTGPKVSTKEWFHCTTNHIFLLMEQESTYIKE